MSPSTDRRYGLQTDRSAVRRRAGGAVLAAPALAAGALIAVWLLVRPYGDAGGDPASMATAFADPAWVPAHVAGALGLAAVGWLTVRMAEVLPSRLSRIARALGFWGAAGACLAFGAEAFGLNALGSYAVDHPDALAHLTEARSHPLGAVLLGAGLLTVGTSAVLTAIGWQRAYRSPAAWPFAGVVALIVPQFWLPPAGRIAFGAFALASGALWATAAWRTARSPVAEPGVADADPVG